RERLLTGLGLPSHRRHRPTVSGRASRYTEWPSASLLRVTSRPAWRSPVMAARTVCGSQPSRCPSSATEAPSGRSSMPISTARFVLARGRSASAPGTLAVGKSAPSEGSLDCDDFPGDRVVFFDTSMLSEAPSGATLACAAAELVSVGADPDRACETRRRGARWRLRAGLFASPVSTCAPLFCLLAGLF